MLNALPESAKEQLFTEARTFAKWQNRPVDDETLRQLYDLLKYGPTSMNCQPGRFVFVRSQAAKERLVPALMDGNVEKVRCAPVTVIVAYDTRFYEHLSQTWPHSPDAKDWFAENEELASVTRVA